MCLKGYYLKCKIVIPAVYIQRFGQQTHISADLCEKGNPTIYNIIRVHLCFNTHMETKIQNCHAKA